MAFNWRERQALAADKVVTTFVCDQYGNVWRPQVTASPVKLDLRMPPLTKTYKIVVLV